jgi:DNA-binding transcriptional regulator YiaG
MIAADTLRSTGSVKRITDEQNFQKRVKLLRTKLELSQDRFAHWLLENHLIDVTRETVTLWEQGRNPAKSYRLLLFKIVDEELLRLVGEHEYH